MVRFVGLDGQHLGLSPPFWSPPIPLLTLLPPASPCPSFLAEVGSVYTKKVRIRNVTGVVRTLRVLPPASQYFHMSLPRFPVEQGSVAPGMYAEVRGGRACGVMGIEQISVLGIEQFNLCL